MGARAGLSTDDEPGYLREHEHITLARALLAQATADGSRVGAEDAARFLGRLLEAAEAGGRGRSVVELLVLRALACRVVGDRDGAAASLDRALALAEPEGYVRLFLDEGPAMAELLAAAAAAGTGVVCGPPASARPTAGPACRRGGSRWSSP